MSNITTTFDGTTVTINEQLFKAYYSEVFDILREQDEQKENFKGVVEAVAETTGLKKSIVSKFFQQRYADKIKEGSEQAELFETLESLLA